MSLHSASILIPLFPLNVVLFPGAQLPLHIFEERYKSLVNECLAQDKVFGINVVHDKQIRAIGCTARVLRMTKLYDDGRMDIIVEGEDRYKLLNVVESPQLYLMGQIARLVDEKESYNSELTERAIILYNSFVEKVFPDTVQKIASPETEKINSFFLVQKAGLDLMQRQAVLSMNSETRRLEFLVQHFEAAIPLLASKKQIEELAKNDGYVVQY